MAVNVNIYDPPYNCRGNGADCWDGWNAAMQYVSQNGGGTVTVPPANAGNYYYLRRPLYFYSGVSLVFTDTSTPVKLNYYISDTDRLNGYEFSFGNINQYGGGDSDIQIIGGVWDCNAYNGSNSQRKIFANGAYNIGFQFIGVNNLDLDTVTIKNSRNWGTLFNQCHGVTLNNITFDQNMGTPDNQDGIHFLGENSNITVSNLGGTTNDDIFALTTADTALGPRVKFGPISGVVLDGLNCAGSLNGVRVGLAGHLIDDVTIRNVSGNIKDWRPINIEAYNYFKPFGYAGRDRIGSLTFENINLSSNSPNYPAFYLDILVDKLTLKNVVKNGAYGYPLLQIVDNTGASGGQAALSMGEINDLVVDGVTSYSTNSVPLIVNAGVIHNATIKNWSGLASTFIQYVSRSGYKETLNVFDNSSFGSKVSVESGRNVAINNFLSSAPPPDLSITYPDGYDIQTDTYPIGTSSAVLSGTVTVGSALTVGTQAVAVGADGSWAATVTLNPGDNNIPVVATKSGISVTKYAYFNIYSGIARLPRPTSVDYDGTNLTWAPVTGAASYRIYYSSSDGRSDGRSSWGDGGVQNPGPFLQNFIFNTSACLYASGISGTSKNFNSGLVAGAWYLVSISAVDGSGNESPISYQREVHVGSAGIYPDDAVALAGDMIVTTTTTQAPTSTTTSAPGTTTQAPGTTTTTTQAPTTTTQAPTLATPGGISLIGSAGSFQMLWDPVSGATSYNIYYTSDGSSPTTSSPAVTGISSTSRTVSGLAAGTYRVSVQAVGATGSSALSTPLSISVSAATAPTSAPECSLVGANGQITINWSAVAGADSYTIYYSQYSGMSAVYAYQSGTTQYTYDQFQPSAAGKLTGISGTTRTRTITGLTPGQTYHVMMQAANSGGAGPLSVIQNQVASDPATSTTTTTTAAPGTSTTSTTAAPSTTTSAPGSTTTLPPATTTTQAPTTTTQAPPPTTTTTAAPKPLVLALQTSSGPLQFAATAGGALQIRTSAGIVEIALGDTPGSVGLNTSKGVKYLQ